LRASRTADDRPAYVEEPAETTEEYPPEPEAPTEGPLRLPIITAHDISACGCIEANFQPARTLAPPRNRQERVRAEAVLQTGASSMLLEDDGSLWTWGDNNWGQLGDGSSLFRTIPIQILDSVVAITPGGGSAIRADGSLWAWGVERFDSWDNMEPPVTPRHLMDDVIAFYQNESSDFAIRADGSLWVWYHRRASNTQWWWGSFVPGEETVPVHVLDSVVAVSIVNNTAFAHQCNGSLWTINGEAATHVMDAVTAIYAPFTGVHWGIYSGTQDIFITQTDGSLWRVRIRHPRDPSISHIMDDVATVYRAFQNDFIIQTDGTLWAMGDNNFGQLGDGTRTRRNEFVRITDSVAYIFPQTDYTFAIKTDGSLWAWGSNDSYQLGDGTTINRNAPVHIMDLVASVHPFWDSLFAIRSDGSLWAWGMNWGGRLGDGTAIYRPTPVHIMDAVAEIYEFSGSIFAIGADGGLWAWGYELVTRQDDGSLPVRILDSVMSIQMGGGGIYAIQDDGNIWMWAMGWGGPFGIGSWVSHGTLVNISYAFSYGEEGSVPSALGYFSNVALSPASHRRQPPFMVSESWGGLAHFMVDADTRLWAWGDNWEGQLGDGSADSRFPPVHIMDAVICIHSSRGIVHALQNDGNLWVWGRDHDAHVNVMDSVTAFYSHWDSHFALKSDGSLWGWGDNWHGQLGGGTDEYQAYPIQIMEQVISAYMHNDSHVFFALQADGSLWSWGINTVGVLGDGTSSVWPIWRIIEMGSITSPTRILEDVATFYLEENSAFAIKTDGTLWAWGDNSGGQLGDGTRINRHTPVRIMDGVGSVHTNGASTFVTRSDGSLWAWGWNAMGQLGDGTTISRLSPVHIDINPLANMHITAGATFAIQDDNSLWAWGGSFGSAPVYIMDAVSFVLADGSGSGYFVVQTGGSLWLLGDSPHDLEFIMGQVAAVHSAGGVHYVMQTDGSLLAWGNNWDGMLGDSGIFIDRDNPVSISTQ